MAGTIERNDQILIYRMDLKEPLTDSGEVQGQFFVVDGLKSAARHARLWRINLGISEAAKTALKILSRKRIFFGTLRENRIAQSGWANLGFCRHYPVERDAVVLGAVWTDPRWRGQGLAPAAMRKMIGRLFDRGWRRFYVDTTPANSASRRMIEKVGFAQVS